MKLPSSYRAADMINRPSLSKEIRGETVLGMDCIVRILVHRVLSQLEKPAGSKCRVGLEGHPGVVWEQVVPPLVEAFEKKGLQVEAIALSSAWKSPETVEKFLAPFLPEDPVFGRIYDGSLVDFFDKRALRSIEKKLKVGPSVPSTGKNQTVLLVYGSGLSLLPLSDCLDLHAYWDLCREEILKRLRAGFVRPLGADAVHPARVQEGPAALPAYFSTRRLYYVDYPLFDAGRNVALTRMDYYVDANDANRPKMLSRSAFQSLFDRLAVSPLKPKPYYDPGPWGGQWLKKVRKLPAEMPNCAWSYDLIEPETGFQVAFAGSEFLEFPFQVLTAARPAALLGSKGRKRKFAGQFPLRINYDDSMGGADMALQSHPGDTYIRETFNEPYRQDESYYIVDTGPGSKVHLGLKKGADLGEFRKAVELAEKKGLPFDHQRFVHTVRSRKHDLFLIPAGTLHGSGKNQNVLEISATTYRYTFHFYDFLRPGLDGKLRAIHADHAFAALRPERREGWVEENLRQEPRLLRKGKGWSEFLIGARRDMFYRVHRLEFDNQVKDDTEGEFHLLVLVEGSRLSIEPRSREASRTELPFSCLAVIPAAVGKYTLRSLGGGPCKVVKVLMA